MKIKISFFVLSFFVVQASFSQNIFFAKENYSDSILFQKNIPILARQAVELYKEADSAKYYDNLFRLHIVARQYDAVEPVLTNLAQIFFGDTVNTKSLGFVFRTFSATMAKNPDKDSFASIYNQTFTAAYDVLSEQGKIQAAQYFNSNQADMLEALNKLKAAYSLQDTLTTPQAVALCRSYCSVMCYRATVPLAKTILLRLEQEKYIKQDSVLIKMPDGGTVSLTIVRDKKITSAQPVVLMYNIYSFADMSGQCKEIVSRGYTGIIADTRGKRLSPDPIAPFEHDAKDAYYIIDWISKQPWCNGKIGMFGGSYLGFSQWSAAKNIHPALKTIVPQAAVAPGVDFPSHNGIFMSYMLSWLHYVTNHKLTDYVDFSDTEKWNSLYAKWFTGGTGFRALDTLEGRPSEIFQRWLQHPSYDQYWKNMTPQKKEFAKINIPILTTTGYWDDDQTGALYYYHQYRKYNKNDNFYLLIGPYDHYGSQDSPEPILGGYAIDSVANIPMIDIVFQWLDHTLKDSLMPALLKDKVNFQVMGTNTWNHVPALKKMSNETLKLFLGNSPVDKKYSLLHQKPAQLGFIQQTVDLKDRNEIRFTIDEESSSPVLVDSLLNPENHQLLFVSDPIDKPFAISGATTASITASLNKKDMDVRFDLYELTPDGLYIRLASNFQRASYAKDHTKRNLLKKGKVQTFEINNTYITCRQLQQGSRIVVVFGINKSPEWQINYGSGKDVSDETILDAEVPMEIKWYNSSYINIPILR